MARSSIFRMAIMAIILALPLQACSDRPVSDLIGTADRLFSLRFGDSAPDEAEIAILAHEDANPDAEGRASPVVLRFFQLSQPGAFQQADYFALNENPRGVLGGTLIDQGELVMAPGSSRELVFSADQRTRAIGVVAGFRDIDEARWRSLIEVDPYDLEPLQVVIDGTDVTIGLKPED